MVNMKKKLLDLEDYLEFRDNRAIDLTARQLRQIMNIHGRSSSKYNKTQLKDMVSGIDLKDLHRSTLLDGTVSGDAPLTLKEVLSDLKDLDWQECHVTSLLTYSADSAAAAVPANQKPKKKRKKRADIVDADPSAVSTGSGTTFPAGSTTDTISPKSTKANIGYSREKK